MEAVISQYSVRFHSLLQCVSSLQLLVQLYNKVQQMAADSEVSLVKADREAIDKQLYWAETELTWQDQGCLNYICQVKDMVYKMERKLQKSRDNVEIIKELMKGWSMQPIFNRKDNKKDTLLMLEDRAARMAKKYSSIRKDGETIHSLLQVQ